MSSNEADNIITTSPPCHESILTKSAKNHGSGTINDVDPNVIQRIKTDLVIPTYYNDIKHSIKRRSNWKRVGDVSGAISKIISCLATIIAFAAGFFSYNLLSFVAGCLGTISLVLAHFSSYAMKESQDNTMETNRILENLGMRKIVDIVVDSDPARNDR